MFLYLSNDNTAQLTDICYNQQTYEQKHKIRCKVIKMKDQKRVQ